MGRAEWAERRRQRGIPIPHDALGHAPRPARASTPGRSARRDLPNPLDLECLDRAGEALAKLDCGCQGAASVFACASPQVPSGKCVVKMPSKAGPNHLLFPNGSRSSESYRPRRDAPETGLTALDLPVCWFCPHRRPPAPATPPPLWPAPPRWPERELHFITTADLARDTARLIAQLPADLSAVIGIPRSGLIPAAQIAATLHLPLYSLDFARGLVDVGSGSRKATLPTALNKVALVDDTTFSGIAMRHAAPLLKQYQVVRCAVYCRNPGHVDLYGVHVPGPHILEWNIFNNSCLKGACHMMQFAGGACSDLDGVICEEPLVSETDQPDLYRQWLPAARIRYPVRAYPLALILTSRVQSHRHETELWLARWRINYARLTMYPADTAQQRTDVAGWKAQEFARSGCGVMFESSPALAEQIHRQTGKIVICPGAAKVWYR